MKDYSAIPPMSITDLWGSVSIHRALVRARMDAARRELDERAWAHDLSKMSKEENQTFCRARPRLQAMQEDGVPLSDPAYKQALDDMGEGLKHHYHVNRHHPEHFPNGILDMNVFDMIEMVCDWSAAAAQHGQTIDWPYVTKRFSIDERTLGLLKGIAQVVL